MPAATGPLSNRSWTSSAPATPWLSGSWIGRAGRCGTWSTPSRASRGPSPGPPRRCPSVMTAHKARVAQEMYHSGQYTVAAIDNTLGVSQASAYRHLTRPDRRVS
jgi:hypothetical protein